MVYRIVESDYKGFHLVHDEANNGWNAIIDEYEIKFPNFNAAQCAINRILDISKDIIKENGGKIIRKPTKFGTSKMVEEEYPY